MNPKRNRNFGKSVERHVAKLLGGMRVGVMGNMDVMTNTYDIECKGTKKCIIDKWFKQAENNCRPNKRPLLFVHVTGQEYRDGYIVMRAAEFKRIMRGKDAETEGV